MVEWETITKVICSCYLQSSACSLGLTTVSVTVTTVGYFSLWPQWTCLHGSCFKMRENMPILYWPIQLNQAPPVGLRLCHSHRYLSTSAILIDRLFWCSVIRAVNGTFCMMEFSVTSEIWVIFSSIAGFKKSYLFIFIFMYYLFMYLLTTLSMTEQPLNTWMCGHNISLTGEKINTT